MDPPLSLQTYRQKPQVCCRQKVLISMTWLRGRSSCWSTIVLDGYQVKSKDKNRGMLIVQKDFQFSGSGTEHVEIHFDHVVFRAPVCRTNFCSMVCIKCLKMSFDAP